MGKATILFVDDEANILQTFKRTLFKDYNVLTAPGGEEALEILKKTPNISVIISDMRMPNMDGRQLLKTTKDQFPDVIRILLTGYADLDSAIDVINEGQIFRFLTKPCNSLLLKQTLKDASRQHELEQSEKELLAQTLRGSIKVLTDILSITNPVAFSSSIRIKQIVHNIIQNLELENSWQYEVASMLSQLGCITLSQETLSKITRGATLNPHEEKEYKQHSEIAASFIKEIPRLEVISEMVRRQSETLFKSELKDDIKKWPDDKIGSQILRISIEFDKINQKIKSPKNALKKIIESQLFPIELIRALSLNYVKEENSNEHKIYLKDLSLNMIITENIYAKNGMLLIPDGQDVTEIVIRKLHNFSVSIGIQEPFMIMRK